MSLSSHRGIIKAKTRIRIPLGAQKYLSLSSHRGIIKAKTRIPTRGMIFEFLRPAGALRVGAQKYLSFSSHRGIIKAKTRIPAGGMIFEFLRPAGALRLGGYKYSWYLASSIQCLVNKLVLAAHILTLRLACFTRSQSLCGRVRNDRNLEIRHGFQGIVNSELINPSLWMFLRSEGLIIYLLLRAPTAFYGSTRLPGGAKQL